MFVLLRATKSVTLLFSLWLPLSWWLFVPLQCSSRNFLPWWCFEGLWAHGGWARVSSGPASHSCRDISLPQWWAGAQGRSPGCGWVLLCRPGYAHLRVSAIFTSSVWLNCLCLTKWSSYIWVAFLKKNYWWNLYNVYWKQWFMCKILKEGKPAFLYFVIEGFCVDNVLLFICSWAGRLGRCYS